MKTDELKSVVNLGRCAMLMEPIAEMLNSILIEPPVRRVMIVAEVFNRVSSKNDTLRVLMERDEVMKSLFNEGRNRGSGVSVSPKAFLSDLRGPSPRESSDV